MINPIIDFIAEATLGAVSSDTVAGELKKRGISGFPKWILTALGGSGLVLALKKLIDFAGHDNELGLNTLKPVELLIPPLKSEFIIENTWKKFNNMPKALGWLESLPDEDKSTLFAFFSTQTSVADYIRQAK
jgi:uncharacterized membrane protein